MITVFMVLAAFAGTATAKGSIECSFSTSMGTQQCYEAEGQQLIFLFPKENNSEIRLTKDEKEFILKIDKKNTITPYGDYINKLKEIQPGKFTLGTAMKKHSGYYFLEEFDANGQNIRKVKVHLEIRAPALNPTVSQRCFSPEQKTVTCSSDGDDVEFFLTLDGHTLIQSRGNRESNSNCEVEKSDVSKICINVHGQLTGGLMCRVQNNVSSGDSVYHLTACKGSISVAIPVVAVFTTALFVVLGFIVFKLRKKRRQMPPNEDNAEDGIIYADVKVIKNTKRTPQNIQGNAN